MKIFKLSILSVSLLFSFSSFATTYYVATTGKDTNSGSSSLPWRNPQKCARSPVKAGDTCVVRGGTYGDTDLNGITVYVDGNSPSGTSTLPIKIMSEKPLAATISVPSSVNAANAGFYITKPYYIIDGFNITGGTKNLGSNVSYAGIDFEVGAKGGIARNNSIHHIGRAVCSNSKFGFSGIFVHDTLNVLVEKNKIYSIGRLRNGESGCVTTLYQNDHGIYIHGSTNLVFRRNVLYDTSRGFPIQSSGGTSNNLSIYHNTISGKSPTGKPAGHIMLATVVKGAKITNNLSDSAASGMMVFYSLEGSSIYVSYNMSSSPSYSTAFGPVPSVVSFSRNFQNVLNLGFANASARDYRLTSSSDARNDGTTSGVPQVPDQRPDIGYFEY